MLNVFVNAKVLTTFALKSNCMMLYNQLYGRKDYKDHPHEGGKP